MQEVYFTARVNLRQLLQQHPDWTQTHYAEELHMSLGWVKKWKKRLREADPQDAQVVLGRSTARHHPPERLDEAVVDRLLQYRDEPPEGLNRTPGPKALLYYLQRAEDLKAQGLRLPRSTSTIYRLLKAAGRIPRAARRSPDPWPLPEAGTVWQMDFKDASSVWVDPLGKRQHVVEVLNIVDVGSSQVLEAEVREDFHAQTTLTTVAAILQRRGRPVQLTCDRDPRLVASPQGSDFPNALRRFLSCLGVELLICPPQRPDRNAFVERYHRSYQHECLAVHQPRTVQEVREVTATYQQHYNHQRPNQARSCGNRPPAVAFPQLASLPPVPEQVDPDAWLWDVHGHTFVRRVSRKGSISLDRHDFYVGQRFARQSISIRVSAPTGQLQFFSQGQLIKVCQVPGLQGQALPFETYVSLMEAQALAEARQWQARPRTSNG